MANKVYHAEETAIVFAPSGGTVVWTPTSVATGAGRISAQWDRGASSKPVVYEYSVKTAFQATPTVGNLLRAYLAESDVSAQVPGGMGTTDAAVATEALLNNARWIGSLVVDRASTAAHYASGLVLIRARYVSLVGWNASGATLSATDGDHEFRLTPKPNEIQ